MRDNPARANFLGVHVARVKLGVFMLAGAYPEFGFWTTSGEAIFMIMLGGTQLFAGPPLLLNHYVTIYTEHHGLVLGSVILLIVLRLRRGVADFAYARLQRRAPALAEPGPEPVRDRAA